jgi:hypothetical protein
MFEYKIFIFKGYSIIKSTLSSRSILILTHKVIYFTLREDEHNLLENHPIDKSDLWLHDEKD